MVVSCNEGVLQGDNHLLLAGGEVHWLTVEEVTERKEAIRRAVKKWEWENTTMEKIYGGQMKMEKQELSGSC